ncbi:MAG: cell division protein FtsZ [Promethearchaeota archaeon]
MNQGKSPSDSVFQVQEPDLLFSKAVQRMDRALPPLKPFSVVSRDFSHLPSLERLPRPRREALVDNDDALRELLLSREVRTLVVGVGGAGNNMTSRFQHYMVPGCRTVCINTDVQDLYYSNSDEKILIGKKLTRGLGAGNNHEIGELAAMEDYGRIKSVMDADVVFLSCGLGGGTGTGATPLIAKAAKENGAMVVSIVTMPFKMEGRVKEKIAFQGLKRIASYSDTVIPISNERLLSLVPDIQVHQGFKIMDEILTRSVKGVLDLITRPGLVNLDFADIKSILERDKRAMDDILYSSSVIGMTEVSKFSQSYLERYTKKALNNPLIDPKTSEIKNALVGIVGDSRLSLKQLNTVVSAVSSQIHPSANLKWGFIADNSLQGKMRITIMGNGFKSPLLEQAMSDPVET